MSALDHYLEAASRANTQRSYASALRHFEVEWGGHLPATPDTVARYLTDYAGRLSINTLRQRLAALAHWHHEHGFVDPTRVLLVRKVLKGIQTLHPSIEKRAEPLQLTVLTQLIGWLEGAMGAARDRGDRALAWRLLRDRAMVLLGFWRGFRSDELIRVQVEHLHLVPGEGMTCFVPRSKGDRNALGMTYKIPALSRLCPVTATREWIGAARLTEGPLFRRVDRWGHVAEQPLHPNSLIPMLRRLLSHAGLENAAAYSSHSLRRGFAGWANANGWDVKALMEYVGWRDVHSAMRYLDGSDPFARQRIEAALASSVPTTPPALPSQIAPDIPTLELELRCVLTPFTPKGRGVRKARRHIEDICLAPWRAQQLDTYGCRYRLVTAEMGEALDEAIATLLDDMHRIAENHRCFLEASLCNLEGGHWD